MEKFINYTRNGRDYTFHVQGEKGDYYFTFETAFYNALHCSRRYKIGQRAATVDKHTGAITTFVKNSKHQGGWTKEKVFTPSKIVGIGTTIKYLRKRWIHKDWFNSHCDSYTEIRQKTFEAQLVECPF